MKTIIEMARKYTVGGLEFDVEGLERFVNDVRANEREACAKVCDDFEVDAHDNNDLIYRECANAIRARGQA